MRILRRSRDIYSRIKCSGKPGAVHDATQLLTLNPNVLLLRTLSKGYSLAGLRLAYGLGNANLIRPMIQKTKDSYNIDAIAQALGTAALIDQNYAQKTWLNIRHQRQVLAQSLRGFGFLAEPSQTNFLLVTPSIPKQIRTAHDIYNSLTDMDIYVRWFDEDRLREKLRITVGTPAENATLVSALEHLL